MLKSNVGYSTLESAKEAGKEIATKAKVGLKIPKVGLLFTSVDYNQKEVIEGVKSIIPDLPVIGCTSSGAIIVPEGVITGEKGFGGMLLLDDKDLEVGVACKAAGKDAREVGREVAVEALEDARKDYAPSYYYMVASPKEEEQYVKGIQDVIGDVPFFGGSAADNDLTGKWQLFADKKIVGDGVAVAFFYTDKEIETVYTGAYEESENVGIITKVIGDRTIAEINHKPALEVYGKWIGKKTTDLQGGALLVESITKPLGVKDTLGDLIAIRHPMAGNADNTISVGNKVATNTALIQMETTVDGLIKSTGKTLKEINKEIDASSYLLVHCGGRKIGIGDRLNEVHRELVKNANGAPFITIFTFGEYGYSNHTRNTCGGLMLSFTGFEK